MNKLFLYLFFLPLLALPGILRAQDVPVPPKPDPNRLVNDFGHAMTPDQISTLEHKLANYDDSTSNQIVVVTMPSIGDADIEEYSVKLFKAWGIGNKKTNNGVLVLVTLDKRTVYITTGYGLEGAIPDVTAKAIIDNEMVPNFRSGNYYRGFDQAADALIKAAAGEYKAPEGYADRNGRYRGRRGGGGGAGIGIFAIIFIIIIISIFRGGRGGGGGGGFFGGGGFLPFLLGTMVGRGLGGGGGGGWSSGDSGGGGGDFGGFGGGDTGGGGAGGSW